MLHVHRSERADRLADALAEVLRERPLDPFSAEVVAVPAKGVERWIRQRLSHVLGAVEGEGDGVCGNIQFPHPSALVADTVAAAGGLLPQDDPWASGRQLWTLVDVVDECVTEEWCSTLAAHLGIGVADAAHRRGRRVVAAVELVRRFDSYGAHRPSMLRDWIRGQDTDGAGSLLSDDQRWQAVLWRRLRQQIGVPSPAERLTFACEQLRASPELVDLPQRLSLFGPTRMTTAQLEVLAALAHRRDIHLWLPHPSAALWDRVASVAAGARPVRRRHDATTALAHNRLLASLGRDARELELLLADSSADAVDHHHPSGRRPATLLGHLQTSLQEDSDAGAHSAGRPLVARADRSLQVHGCHGPARQVEVLREVLVGLLAADHTLEPRDILVMCPDIEDYAPLIAASFGLEGDDVAGTRHPGHRLRARLADRSLRQTNPLLGTVAALVELADARITASELLDLAASEPVRRRFRFSDDDLEQMQEWITMSGVRWGLDAAHRDRFGLASVAQNTWRAGLDRMLLGAAMAEDELRSVGLALPLDDVDSSDIELVGRLAEFVDRLTAILDGMAGERPLADWLATLTGALDRLTDVREAEAWQSAQARRELAQLATDAGMRATSTTLLLADIHALLTDRLAGRPTRANFRTGNLTMCSMVPMRSVPHRVVCLLGMDDGSFPRGSGVDGDDILMDDPCVGERDPRSEDRQLLLDAVLAATEHLVILYTGADPRTNADRPPAVPVGEILDAVDATVLIDGGSSARDHVVVHHPLQPFDPRNFTAGTLGSTGPFSFDRHALRGAERSALPPDAERSFLSVPLPVDGGRDIALDDLFRFLENPARAFLRQRLGLTLVPDEEELDDGLTVELDSLQQWAVGDRLLKSRLAGTGADACVQAEWRRGTLPPGELGKRVVSLITQRVEPLVAASTELRRGKGTVGVDVVIEVGGRELTGTIGNLYGDTLVRVEYSRLSAKHRLRAWGQLLALCVADPMTRWTAVTIGRGPGDLVQRSSLGPIEGESARRHLGDLVDLYVSGMSAPLPMAVKTSAAYAGKRAKGMTVDNAVARAQQEWTGDRYDGERAEESHRIIWGEAAPLRSLLAERPQAGEHGRGWDADESTRFGLLARRLWEPIQAAETLGPA